MFLKVVKRTAVSIFDNKSQMRKIEIRIDITYKIIFFFNISDLIIVI